MVPIIQISLDGQDISSKVNARILNGEAVMCDGQRADELTLHLSNHDGRLAKPARGARLSVSLGFQETGIGYVGLFEVQEVQKVGASAEFHVRAHSADMKKTLKNQKNRSWVKGETLGAILSRVAADNGLSPAISGALAAIVPGPTYQTNESDMHLITRLAAHYGAIGKPADGKLVFVEKGSGQSASGADMPAVSLTPNDLEADFTIGDKDRHDRGKVKAHHFDHARARRIEVSAGGGDGPDYTMPRLYPNKEQAEKACKARKAAFDRAKKSFSGTFKTGDTRAKPGGVLTSSGFGDDDDGDWSIKRVVHQFNGSGYTTRFEAETKGAKT